MKAEIITIGDEILIGQIVDTNSAWMAQKLNSIGVAVKQISSVSDNKEHIIEALDEAAGRADIIFITGGLGPTKDDITKNTLAEYFSSKMIVDQAVLDNVNRLFASFGAKVSAVNEKQAEVLEVAEILMNKYGTAPGMWISKGEKVFISLPGVPYEMKSLLSDEVIPRIKERFEMPAIVHRTVLTQGIGESFLAEKIAEWATSLEAMSISLAYLPSPGMVRLRLSAVGKNGNELDKRIETKVEELKTLIPKYIFGTENEKLEKIIGEMLIESGNTLATAESCTGGYIAHKITSMPGSSKYFKGSIVAYSNEVKADVLGLDKRLIEDHGAVSEQVALAMAVNVKDLYKSDYSISCTGVAGPDGGTTEKPVGTVWIALAAPDKVTAKKFLFGDNRERNIQITAVTALNMLKKEIESGKNE